MTKLKQLALVMVALLFGAGGATLGGVYTQTIHEFYQGLKAGTTNQLVIDSSGNVTTSGNITATGGYTTSSTTEQINTVRTSYQYDDSLNAASTTVCSLISPTATSTLIDASVHFTVGSSTTATVVFSKGPGFASTTALNDFSLTGGAQGTFSLIGTTTAVGVANYTFAPSQYFNVTMNGGIGTFSPTGECQAVFRNRT
jgi:hypothetical protein